MRKMDNPLPGRRLFRLSIIAIMIGLMVATGSLAGLTFGQQVYDDPDQQGKNKLPDVNTQGADTTDVRVARISLINDHISFQRGDDEEWYDATLNTPVQAGDRLYTGDEGRLELQLDGIFLRLDKKTGLDVIDLSSHAYQFRLFTGTATIKVSTFPKQPFEIDTPGGAITILRAGNYRINVRENGSSDVVVTEGSAEVYNNDTYVTVHQAERMEIEGGGNNYYDITELPKKDDWDVWNDQRNDALAQAQSPKYVEQQVAGVEDLDRYGKWVNTQEYGNAWQPEVSSDWAPYQDGEWAWRDPYGWTWISNEPWGWAPYHYGRWAHVGARWCWVPSGLGFYSPALVGFLGFGRGGFIGWVPLAPYEIFTPWWRVGRGYYIGNRRYASAVYVSYFYINQRYRQCVTVFPRDRFTGGRFGNYRATFLRDGFGPSRTILANSILPTRRSLALGPVRENFKKDAHVSVFSRTVIAKNNNAPVVSRFSDNLHGIRAGGGMPVSQFQTTSGGGRVTKPIHVNSATSASFNRSRDVNGSTGGRGFVRRTDASVSGQPRVDGNRNNNGSASPQGQRPVRAIDRPFVPPPNNRPSGPVNNGTGDVRRARDNNVKPQTPPAPSRSVERSRDAGRQSTPTRDSRMEQRPSRPAPQPRAESRSRPQYTPPPRSESRTQSRPSSSSSRSESRGSSRSSSSSSSSHSSGGSSHSSGSSGRSSGSSSSGRRGH